MIIDAVTANLLRDSAPGWMVRIDGKEYQVLLVDFRSPDKEGVHDGWFVATLKEAGSSKEYSLKVIDSVITVKLEAEMAGPAPLNSNPDVFYVQGEKTTKKYSMTRKEKQPISAELYENGERIGMRSLAVLNRKTM